MFKFQYSSYHAILESGFIDVFTKRRHFTVVGRHKLIYLSEFYRHIVCFGISLKPNISVYMNREAAWLQSRSMIF